MTFAIFTSGGKRVSDVYGDCRGDRRFSSLVVLLAAALSSSLSFAQTPSTGALTGLTLDPSGASIAEAAVSLVSEDTRAAKSTASDAEGRFGFVLLAPGRYRLCASKAAFALACMTELNITVTETRRVELRLRVAALEGKAEVPSDPSMVQADNSALGRVVNSTAVSGLPLVTRNFSQIATLSPGVTAGVSNAGELGVGGTALSQIAKSNDGIFVHGLRSYDNNWQLDGVSVSDVQGNGAGSGGIPTPNPDSIQEFKVQTGLYDAAYGRYAGANISVITKSGGNEYHGTLFEFLRNDILNANDFFRNKTGQERAPLKQNQFGLTLGGPIKKEKLFFFGSYQETRQVNGIAAGQSRIACTASLSEPPLTDDRSPAALGRLFGGMTGALGGTAIESDGSNINPAALALLNRRLSDGTFLIPTPQTLDATRSVASQGFSVFSEPCHFNEDQFSTNMDYRVLEDNELAARFFFADDSQTVSFPGNVFNPVANIRGFSTPADGGYRVFSLADTHTFSSSWLNEARIAYVRTRKTTVSNAPFKWSDVGVLEGEMSRSNELPNLNILGSVAFASAFPFKFAQNSLVLSDDLSFIHRAHAVRLGGSLTRFQNNFRLAGLGSFVQFLSWPDFVLGLNAGDNGTGTFSNVFASADVYGLFDRDYRAWESSAFAQDDYKISKAFTLNIGIRYERLGQFGDKLGRNSSFDISKADPNPPAGGSIAGYIVASNFGGAVPPGVEQTNNTSANDGAGQNVVAPRIGFAWHVLPGSSQLALRGGYGVYFSRPTGQAFFQNGNAPPFASLRLNIGQVNSDATFQSPFPQPFPTPDTFPLFEPYSPTTATSVYTVSPDFRGAVVQQYSMNLQSELHDGWLLEVGYVGTLGKHLQRFRSLNQAQEASAGNPIRGVTTNTIANVALRVPILGIPADSLQEVESAGNSQYNGLEASLTKRLSHTFQFLASYTFSKTLDTDGADINGTSAGIVLTLGNQNSPGQRWGRASFDRTHRFILSGTWTIPSPSTGFRRAAFGGWDLAIVATIQSGSALTVANSNATNVFGISEDRAQLSGSCTRGQLVTAGAIGAKLNNYFNASCFTSPPVIGTDGIGTAFGNSGTGIIDGPGQFNLDIALAKTIPVPWPHDKNAVQIRAEFFNIFNHAQFANPDTNSSSPTFGVISSTAVNPRVGQLALRFSF